MSTHDAHDHRGQGQAGVGQELQRPAPAKPAEAQRDPIGSPMITAAVVETAARRSVTESRLIR